MNEYTYCHDCDTTVDLEHFNDDGSCSIQDIREVLQDAKERNAN